MSEFEILRQLKDKWSEQSKNTIFFGSTEKQEPKFTCYLQAGTLIVRLILIIGKRGGLREMLFVADTANERLSEQLIIAYERYAARVMHDIEVGLPTLLDLRSMRDEIRQGADRQDVCKAYLLKLIEKVLDGSFPLEQELRTLAQVEKSSLFGGEVRGGAPGLHR